MIVSYSAFLRWRPFISLNWIHRMITWIQTLAITWVTAVAEEITLLRIDNLMAFVTFMGTDWATATIICETASVTEIPVLSCEFFLCRSECAYFFMSLHIFLVVRFFFKLFLLKSFYSLSILCLSRFTLRYHNSIFAIYILTFNLWLFYLSLLIFIFPSSNNLLQLATFKNCLRIVLCNLIFINDWKLCLCKLAE